MSESLGNLNEPDPRASVTSKQPDGEPRTRRWWAASIAVSLVLALVLMWLWSLKRGEGLDTAKLVDQAAVDAFLLEHWQTRALPDAVTLPTGIFVQSLSFINTSDVRMSGYIWQRRTDGVHDDFAEGFILPDQIDSIVKPREEYRVRHGDQEVIGWHFEGAFRHPLDYGDYPFDQEDVWIRIWPKDLFANIVLVPDLGAYPCPTQPERSCTGAGDTFGIESTLALNEYEEADTYFDYVLSSYSSNFGIDDYVGQTDFPELRFNIVLRRLLEDATTLYTIPLLVAVVLAFLTLISTTRLEVKASRFGFNTFQSIAIISALFWILLLAQGQVRLQFQGLGFVYIELLYFVMYFVLLVIAINAYLVSSPGSSDWWIIRYKDNLISKVSYWPLLLGVMMVSTALTL